MFGGHASTEGAYGDCMPQSCCSERTSRPMQYEILVQFVEEETAAFYGSSKALKGEAREAITAERFAGDHNDCREFRGQASKSRALGG